MRPITRLTLFLVLLAACAPATYTPISSPLSPTPRRGMVHASPAPGEVVPTLPPATAIPATTPPASPAAELQTVALIQELYEFRYWPDPLIVQANVLLELYAVTTAREHINRWQIGPFEQVSVMPGQVFTFAFTPEQAGEFQVFNVGHNFAGSLIVAADCAEAQRLRTEQGVQAFALIHSPADGRLFPDIITVRLGLPVRLYHMSVSGDHQVSVEALAAEAISVGPRGIAQMDFTPEQAGEFAIRHSDDALAGRLVARKSACPDT